MKIFASLNGVPSVFVIYPAAAIPRTSNSPVSRVWISFAMLWFIYW